MTSLKQLSILLLATLTSASRNPGAFSNPNENTLVRLGRMNAPQPTGLNAALDVFRLMELNSQKFNVNGGSRFGDIASETKTQAVGEQKVVVPETKTPVEEKKAVEVVVPKKAVQGPPKPRITRIIISLDSSSSEEEAVKDTKEEGPAMVEVLDEKKPAEAASSPSSVPTSGSTEQSTKEQSEEQQPLMAEVVDIINPLGRILGETEWRPLWMPLVALDTTHRKLRKNFTPVQAMVVEIKEGYDLHPDWPYQFEGEIAPKISDSLYRHRCELSDDELEKLGGTDDSYEEEEKPVKRRPRVAGPVRNAPGVAKRAVQESDASAKKRPRMATRASTRLALKKQRM